MLSGIGFRSERVTVHVQCLWRTVFLVFPHLQHINGDKYVVDVVLARHEIQCRPSLSMYAQVENVCYKKSCDDKHVPIWEYCFLPTHCRRFGSSPLIIHFF